MIPPCAHRPTPARGRRRSSVGLVTVAGACRGHSSRSSRRMVAGASGGPFFASNLRGDPLGVEHGMTRCFVLLDPLSRFSLDGSRRSGEASQAAGVWCRQPASPGVDARYLICPVNLPSWPLVSGHRTHSASLSLWEARHGAFGARSRHGARGGRNLHCISPYRRLNWNTLDACSSKLGYAAAANVEGTDGFPSSPDHGRQRPYES